jgi:hypothetical protein
MGQVERLKNGLPLERPTRIHPVRKGFNRQTGVYKHLNNKHLISREDPVIQEIQQLRESGLSFRQIARQVGYEYPTCYRIVSGTYPFREPAKD